MDATYIAVHIEEDREHWWFRGRLAVLLAVLRRVLPPPPVRLLELGCGTGNVLAALAEFGPGVGIEPNPALRTVARAHGLDVRDGRLPGDLDVEPVDVVLLLDVLEHLEDELGSLETARNTLRPGGRLVVTVPAYRWLWSSHDVVLGHQRRYTARELARVVGRAGFVIDRVSYFNTLLFAGIALVRAVRRLSGRAGHDLTRPRPAVNRVLQAIFAFERHLVPVVDLPFGASLLLIGRR